MGKKLFNRPVVTLAAAMALSFSILLSGTGLAAKPPASGVTGITGTTYETICDANNVCATKQASLIIYVYLPGSSNPLLNFTSSRRGTFKQALPAGDYTLKGTPNCGFQQCILPQGNVPITVTDKYLSLSLRYDPSLGLTTQ
jgi:hypothetical protein